MLNLTNGDSIDINNLRKDLNKNDKKETRREKLDKKVKSTSGINDIMRYAKILKENNKNNIKKLENEIVNKIKDLNKDLEYYNSIVNKANKNKFLSFDEIEKISSLFNKIYTLIKIETSKLLFFKSFQMIEENGVKKIILNNDTLNIVSTDFGIENPYKKMNEFIEKKNELKEEANKIFYEASDIKENQIPNIEQNIEMDKKDREEAIKQFEKKHKTLEENWKNVNSKIKELDKKIDFEKNKFDNSLLSVLINAVEKSSMLGTRTVREIRINPNINLDDFLNIENVKERTFDLNETIGKLVGIRETTLNNSEKISKMRERVAEKKKINIEDPQFGSFHPVGPSL